MRCIVGKITRAGLAGSFSCLILWGLFSIVDRSIKITGLVDKRMMQGGGKSPPQVKRKEDVGHGQVSRLRKEAK